MLTHELQERVAEAMGCPGESPRQRVEALMSDYFRTPAPSPARSAACSEPPGRPPNGRPDPRRAAFRDWRRRHPVRRSRGAASRPSLWIEIFRLALADGCPVSEQALDCIEQNLDRYTADDFAGTEAERQQLRALFYPRPGIYARLSEMHDCGLLNPSCPSSSGSLPRHPGLPHKYTVDEHTLLTIRGLEALWNPSTAGRKRFGALLEELRAPEQLSWR